MEENVDLQQTACARCQILQSEINADRKNSEKYFNLKKKIIETDLLINKYKDLEKQFEVKRKRFENATSLITKLKEDLNSCDARLKEALLSTDPLKKKNAEIISQNSDLANKVTNLEKEVESLKKDKLQCDALFEKLGVLLGGKDIHKFEHFIKKDKDKLNKSKEEISSVKNTLKETRSECVKLQMKNGTILKYLVLFGNQLQAHNLLNKAQKRAFIKYSQWQDATKQLCDSDSSLSEFEDEGSLIESQLLNLQNSANEVSVQTENFYEAQGTQTEHFYETQFTQTEGYFEISDEILNDVMEQFISIPKPLSPLPPSPKRYNTKKRSSVLDNEINVSLECCGCCKKVVRHQAEIDILKSKSYEISRKSQDYSQQTHNDREKPGSFEISTLNADDSVCETVEENLIDNDHSYCSAKIGQNSNLTATDGNEKNEYCVDPSVGINDFASELPLREKSQLLVKSTPNIRFTVPFLKKGLIFKAIVEDFSSSLLEARYKVKFFKKSNLYSTDGIEGADYAKKLNSNPSEHIINASYAISSKNISCKNNCKSTATEKNNCKQTQIATATQDSYSPSIIGMSKNVFDEADADIEYLFSDENGQNTLLLPLKTTPTSKRLLSRSTKSTTLKRPRVQPGVNPLIIMKKCTQSLRRSTQVGKRNCNGVVIAPSKSSNTTKNVTNTESGATVDEYITPIPKKVRISHCSKERASSTFFERNTDDDSNECHDKLMIDLFGDEQEEPTKISVNVTNLVKDITPEICEPIGIAESSQIMEKEISGNSSIVEKNKSKDLQNDISLIESVQTIDFGEPDVALAIMTVMPPNEPPIDNSTDDSASNIDRQDSSGCNISLAATQPVTNKDNLIEKPYKLTWNSLLSNNIFAKRQYVQKNELKSGSEVIKSVIQVMASLSTNLLNDEHAWKGVVHRLEEAFTNHFLNVNLLVMQLSSWIQVNPIETLDFTTALPVTKNCFNFILTEEEVKCSILTKYLKTSSFGECYLNSLNVIFFDAMMTQTDVNKKSALCRFLISLHKENKSMEAARIFCYDIMYHSTSTSGILLSYVFSIWPEVFLDDSAKRSCIMKTICFLLRKEHAALGVSRGFFSIFQRFFQFESTTDDLENTVILLLHQIGHDKSLYFEAFKSIELIAKVKQWNWTKLLIQRLIQILSQNGWKLLEKRDMMPEHLVKANLLYLLGCLGKQSPIEDTETSRNILKIVKLFISIPKEPFCIKETAALVSLMLINFDQGAAIFMVQKWLPYNTRRISESLKMLLIKHNLWSS